MDYQDLNRIVGKDIFDDPDAVGGSEYRMIIELLGDALDGNERDTTYQTIQYLSGILLEVQTTAAVLIEDLDATTVEIDMLTDLDPAWVWHNRRHLLRKMTDRAKTIHEGHTADRIFEGSYGEGDPPGKVLRIWRNRLGHEERNPYGYGSISTEVWTLEKGWTDEGEYTPL